MLAEATAPVRRFLVRGKSRTGCTQSARRKKEQVRRRITLQGRAQLMTYCRGSCPRSPLRQRQLTLQNPSSEPLCARARFERATYRLGGRLDRLRCLRRPCSAAVRPCSRVTTVRSGSLLDRARSGHAERCITSVGQAARHRSTPGLTFGSPRASGGRYWLLTAVRGHLGARSMAGPGRSEASAAIGGDDLSRGSRFPAALHRRDAQT
jgi:hypothetical protein